MSPAAAQRRQYPGSDLPACRWGATGLEKPPHLRGNLSIARPHSTMSGQQLEQAMAMLQAMQKEQQARDELMWR